MTDDIRRGQRAEMILNDDLFKEAIAEVRDKAIEDFKAASPADLEALQAARMQIEAAERFIGFFVKLMRDGSYAKRRAEPPKTHPANIAVQ